MAAGVLLGELINHRPGPLLLRYLDDSYCVLEDKHPPLGGLNKEFIGIVRFKCPCDGLPSREQAYHDLLAPELGDELWWSLFWYPFVSYGLPLL